MKKKFFFLTLAFAAVSMAACTPSHDKTIANLKAAIDGESTASAKYAAYAVQAAQDSLYSVQALFEATSAAEAIHIKNHQAVLAELGVTDYIPTTVDFEVKTTPENLQTAIDGEAYESTTMYPSFIKDAETEEVQNAVISFNFAQDAEKKHAEIYESILANLATPEALASAYYICPKCGNAYVGTPSEVCELCQAGSDMFLTFEANIPAPAVEDAPAK